MSKLYYAIVKFPFSDAIISHTRIIADNKNPTVNRDASLAIVSYSGSRPVSLKEADVFSSALQLGSYLKANAKTWDPEYVDPPSGIVIEGDLTSPVDDDGAKIQRVKAAHTGWHKADVCLVFKSSSVNSLVNDNHLGVSESDAAVRIFDINWVECAAADCVYTVLDWEPDYDYEIISGRLRHNISSGESCTAFLVMVPDVPAAYGGSKEVVRGIPLKLFPEGYSLDGKAAKRMNYDPIYHTNKVRLVVKHDQAVTTHEYALVIQYFREFA